MAMAQMIAWVFSLGSLGVNLALLLFVSYVILLMRQVLGILHPDTMTQILTGFKPIQTTITVLIFLGGVQRHKAMLVSLSLTDTLLRRRLLVSPPLRRYSTALRLGTALVAVSVFLLRLSQYVLSGEVVGRLWLADASLLFVPALSVIQLLPLFYFVLVTKLLSFWFRSVTTALRNDIHLHRHSIAFYYSLYLRLCSSMVKFGRFFNPFIFLSLAMSVTVLCLTIYFFVNAKEIFTIPDGLQSTQTQIVVAFLPLWAGIQICTAVVYIIALAVAGVRTNETSREIMDVIITLLPSDDFSRYQLLLFTTKIQTQHAWGVTVWGAFLIERGLILTTVSAIVTYTVVLINLQQGYARPISLHSSAFGLLFNGTISQT